MVTAGEFAQLRSHCASCAGLCCVALTLTRSADFAIDKPAGTPCPHLTALHRCDIHAGLRERGFAGCTAFECFGAGQVVTGRLATGHRWGATPATDQRAFADFAMLRHVGELRWYLAQAEAAAGSGPLARRVAELTEQVQALSGELGYPVAGRGSGDEADGAPRRDPATAADGVGTVGARGEVRSAVGRLEEVRDGVGKLLAQVSETVRAGTPRARRFSRRGADLVGASLAGQSLRGADLRGALLMGADLSGCDLTGADLLGADLRGARLGDADLAAALFLTPPQVGAANGNARTTLPAEIGRPPQW